MSATVFERRYVLKPERGGVVRLPGAGATLWDTFTFNFFDVPHRQPARFIIHSLYPRRDVTPRST